jgi:hypothetical protein
VGRCYPGRGHQGELNSDTLEVETRNFKGPRTFDGTAAAKGSMGFAECALKVRFQIYPSAARYFCSNRVRFGAGWSLPDGVR